MPSKSLIKWGSARRQALDEIEAAHRVVMGLDPGQGQGQPYAVRQIHQAYTVLLSSQFQGYCRDLHSECMPFMLATISHPVLRNACKRYFSLDQNSAGETRTPAISARTSAGSG